MNKTKKISSRILRDLLGYLVAVGAVALATWLKYLAQPKIIPADVPILYLLAIVPTAIFFGLGPSLIVCILSFLAYDYYFLPPVHQLNFNANQTPIMVIFLLVGVLFSYLAANLRRQNQVAIKEIAARKQSEAELMNYRDHLEELVQQRTADLEKTNLALIQAKAESEAIIQAMPDAVYFGNKNGITRCNARALEMLGASSLKDLQDRIGELGIKFRVRYQKDRNSPLVEPENLPFNRALKGETAMLDTWATKGSTGLDVYIRGNAAPVIVDSKVIGAVAVNIDITNNKQLEEQLRLRSEEQETIMEVVPVAIWVAHDPECHNITGNRTANEFYEASEGDNVSAGPEVGEPVPSRRFFQNGRELRAEELPMQEAAARNEDVTGSEFEVKVPSGNMLTLLGSASPLRDEGGKVRGAVAAFLDITARKQIEVTLRQRTAELEASNKELESFSYSVSHDLRAPLRSITGFSNVLLEDYSKELDNEGKSYLKKISDSGELMGQLMDDLLKLFRVTRSDLTMEKLDLSDMARKIVSDLAENEPERKVKVTIAPDMVTLGDKNLLNLALQNLLGNAWKYSSKTAKPQIEMGITDHNGKQAYFVRDDGVGFDMVYANKLFQPFQRLHKATEFAGTGIGLASVQRIIRRHGGEVWAESRVGEGATFYFTLN